MPSTHDPAQTVHCPTCASNEITEIRHLGDCRPADPYLCCERCGTTGSHRAFGLSSEAVSARIAAEDACWTVDAPTQRLRHRDGAEFIMTQQGIIWEGTQPEGMVAADIAASPEELDAILAEGRRVWLRRTGALATLFVNRRLEIPDDAPAWVVGCDTERGVLFFHSDFWAALCRRACARAGDVNERELTSYVLALYRRWEQSITLIDEYRRATARPENDQLH